MKKILAVITIIIASFFITSCAKDQVKQPDTVGAASAFVKASNDQLAKYPVSGFGYKSSVVPAQGWDKWATVAAPVIKGIVDKLPEGYVMEVRGHTDARGPEDPEGDKPGNLKISRDRATAVVNSLARKGISSSRITARGVGSSELLAGVDSSSAAQRRVTFVVVPK